MSERELFQLILATSLVLWLLPAVVRLGESQRLWLKRAAVAVLAAGFAIAILRTLFWLAEGRP
jgi:hypothetical protein